MSRETGKAIRQIIKTCFGLNSRQVSVRVSHTSVDVKVKYAGLGVTPEMIREKIKGYEEISRCPVTGDILSGGNFFVFASWASGVHAEREARLASFLQEKGFHFGGRIHFGGDRFQLYTDRSNPWLRFVDTAEEFPVGREVWYQSVAAILSQELGHLKAEEFKALLDDSTVYSMSVNEVVEAYRSGKIDRDHVSRIAESHPERHFLVDLLGPASQVA